MTLSHLPIPKGFLSLHKCQEERAAVLSVPYGHGVMRWSNSIPLPFHAQGERGDYDQMMHQQH